MPQRAMSAVIVAQHHTMLEQPTREIVQFVFAPLWLDPARWPSFTAAEERIPIDRVRLLEQYVFMVGQGRRTTVTRGYSSDHGLHTACIPTLLIVVRNPSLFSTLFVFRQPLDPLSTFVLRLLYQIQLLSVRPQRSHPAGGSSRKKTSLQVGTQSPGIRPKGMIPPYDFSHTTVTDVYRKALLCRPVQLLRRLC
jgi:hypothetical protein